MEYDCRRRVRTIGHNLRHTDPTMKDTKCRTFPALKILAQKRKMERRSLLIARLMEQTHAVQLMDGDAGTIISWIRNIGGIE